MNRLSVSLNLTISGFQVLLSGSQLPDWSDATHTSQDLSLHPTAGTVQAIAS